jgi:hypothetical protein
VGQHRLAQTYGRRPGKPHEQVSSGSGDSTSRSGLKRNLSGRETLRMRLVVVRDDETAWLP